jgi:phytoene synthase
MTPEQYVQQKAAASGSSFYYAFLFLPRPARAITAFYAFCREVDDVVDEVSDPGVAQTKLAWWKVEVARSFAGTAPTRP